MSAATALWFWLSLGAQPAAVTLPCLARPPAIDGVLDHGTADRNCPYEKTVALVERLEAAGAKVVFVTEEGKGHEAPSEATTARYFAWLEDVVR